MNQKSPPKIIFKKNFFNVEITLFKSTDGGWWITSGETETIHVVSILKVKPLGWSVILFKYLFTFGKLNK